MNGESVKYDPTRSLIPAGNVQDAIDSLADSTIKVFSESLSTGKDLNDVFEEGNYSYTATASNVPSNSAGRLVVMHTTDAHISQFAFPNNNYYILYMRHYSKSGNNYVWSSWYSLSFNTCFQTFNDIPYGYGYTADNGDEISGSFQIIKYLEKNVSPSNFSNSIFEVTSVSQDGYAVKHIVAISSNAAVITRIDSNTSNVHPDIRKTSSNNVYVRMIDDNASPQPSTRETVYVYVVKIR